MCTVLLYMNFEIQEDAPANGSSWIVKRVSFLFNDGKNYWLLIDLNW